MTQAKPVFNISEFELRNFTNPYLTPAQATDVALTEARVNGQLDFLAQMLGWNGPNYWDNLPDTPSQKRQLLGGTFGVYNSYFTPRIYEIRNWDNTIVIDEVPYLNVGQRVQVAAVVLGENTYQIESVTQEDDKYVLSLGSISEEFLEQIAAGEPLQIDAPDFRPAPFTRTKVGASGDYAFHCASPDGSSFKLYPGYDSQANFPFQFPILFLGSVYYFDQPVYLSLDSSTLEPETETSYDPDKELWYFKIPDDLDPAVGFTAYLVWNNNGLSSSYSPLQVTLQGWSDPSDWSSQNVLNNFLGAWGNKGGALPFNLAFDSLNIHGFSEKDSVFLTDVSRPLYFNDIVNYVYSQKALVSPLAPPSANVGDIWWNSTTGILAVYVENDSGCNSWVEIDYRNSPRSRAFEETTFADVPAFRAAVSSLPAGAMISIADATGLDTSDGVIGLQGALSSGAIMMHREGDSMYWIVDELRYANVAAFGEDALLLPQKVPVLLRDSAGLSPEGLTYNVTNLKITIAGDYEVFLIKYYNNTTWEIYPDSLLKYIAYSALYGGLMQGQMWWDFDNVDSQSRTANMWYEEEWVGVNKNPQTGPPTTALNLSVVLFYCDGELVTDGVPFSTDDFSLTISSDPSNGKYDVVYRPRTFKGSVQLPEIVISDSLTTTYRADISELVFSGLTYYMSPSVYNSETPLRLWKSQDLQVSDSTSLLDQNAYANPLLADINSGPGPENWEKYFVRLPLEYGRDGTVWQKTTLICKDFAYWGSGIEPERMKCPPEPQTPAIYEELFLYNDPIPDYTYVYTEPYLYSNLAYFNTVEDGPYRNGGVFPASDVKFDEFDECELVEYDPLHNRQADTTSPLSEGYGDWLGVYVNVNPCTDPLTGHYTTDLLNNGIDPVVAPVWDASIYKFAPTCENARASYDVDTNHYKVGYSYFVADASAAEDGFFDVAQEEAWRYPETQPRTGYLTPR